MSMITAREARLLSEESDSKINFILSELEKEILKEAIKGSREYKCYKHVEWGAHKKRYNNPETTPVQSKLVERLADLGYQAKMCWDGDGYVPRGLANDDGGGDMHQNYVLIISW